MATPWDGHIASWTKAPADRIIDLGNGSRVSCDQNPAVGEQRGCMTHACGGHVASWRERSGRGIVAFGGCKGYIRRWRAELSSSSNQDLTACKQGRRVRRPCRGHVASRAERAWRLRHYHGAAADYVQQ